VEVANNRDEGNEGIANLDCSLTVRGDAGRHNYRRCAATMKFANVLFVFNERDVSRLRFPKRTSGGNDQVSIAYDLSFDQLCQSANGDAHRPTSFLP
jgi:hypothetical protein